MKRLIVANWKMHPDHEADAERLLNEFSRIKVPDNVEAVVCPPMPYLVTASKIIDNMSLGSQDVQWENGELTGEITPVMLKDLNVKCVIVGHSERREKLHETNEDVWKKFSTIAREGLCPILCVGEPWEVRRGGFDEALKYVLNQLEHSTTSLIPISDMDHVVIAYEPIWSISTSAAGQRDTPADAAKMIRAIKEFLNHRHKRESSLRVIYGGTVNKDTARGYLSERDIDGALVGHASLDAEEFQKILNAAAD